MRLNAVNTSLPKLTRIRIVVTTVIFGLVILLVTFLFVAEHQLRVPLQYWADSRITNMATLSIVKAVEAALHSGGDRSDLIDPIAGETGVNGLSYDWTELLRMKIAITESIVEAVKSMAQETIPVPLGELIGMNLFAARGPTMPVRIIPVGAVTTDMRFDFQSQGINQVLHRIYIDIQVRMRVAAPFIGTEIVVREQIPVTTELIQGKVPDAVINWSGSIDELRHSVPPQ